MKSSDTLTSIAPALVKAINAIDGVKRDASNPHFKSKFATLEAVIDAAQHALASNGLTVLQGPGLMQGNALTVSTRLLHESGEWIETEFAIPMAKQDPQAAGSAVTYARRYSLMAMLNMPAVDDDGESAMQRGQSQQPQQQARRDTGPGEVDGVDWWGAEGSGVSAHQAKKEGWDDLHEQLRSQIDQLHTAAEWKDFCATNSADIKKMPKSWRMILRGEAEERGKFLGAIQ